MLAKKDKTRLICEDAITAYHKFETMFPEMLCALSGFLYSTESDRASRIMIDLVVILFKAKERAEQELSQKPRRPIPPPVDMSKIPDFDPTDKWEEQ